MLKRRINSLLRKAYILCNWSLVNHVQFIFGSKQMRALLDHFCFYGEFKTWPNSQLEYCIHTTWEKIFSYFVPCRLKISKGSSISPNNWCRNEAWHKVLRHFPSPSFLINFSYTHQCCFFSLQHCLSTSLAILALHKPHTHRIQGLAEGNVQ